MVYHRFIIRAVTITAIAIAITVNAANFTKASFHASVNTPFVPLTLSVSPTAIVGGNQVTATIVRSSTNGEMEVQLESLNAQVAGFGSSTTLTRIKIPNGSASATVPVRTFGVAGRTNVTLRATIGSDVGEATLTVNPASVKSLSISPSKVIGGANATGTVTLDGLAPSNAGVTVQLSLVREADSRTSTTNSLLPSIEQSTSPATSSVSIASSINVPPGGSSATFAINTTPVAVDTSIRIDARKSDGSVREASTRISDGTSNTIAVGELTGTAASARLTVSAAAPSKLLFNPSSVPGGAGVIGTVVLTGKAPVGGLPISLFELNSSAGVNVATVPNSLTVPAGTDRQDFKITTNTTSSAQSVTITAVVSSNNLKQINHGLPDGTSNTISVSDGSVRSVSGAFAATGTLSITPTPPPFTIAVQPSQVIGGAPVTISLTVQPTAASTSNSIALTSNHPELLPLPASVPVGTSTTLSSAPPGAVINATTNTASADQNVTITATGFSTTASATLLVKQTPVPPPVVSISATQPNASKDGPANGIVTVTRTGASSQSLTVSYSINDPSAGSNPHPAVNGVDFQQLSGQVVIPAGSSSATITVIPIPDNKHGPELRVILQLLTPSNGTYTIQSGSSQATIKIKQHEGNDH